MVSHLPLFRGTIGWRSWREDQRCTGRGQSTSPYAPLSLVMPWTTRSSLPSDAIRYPPSLNRPTWHERFVDLLQILNLLTISANLALFSETIWTRRCRRQTLRRSSIQGLPRLFLLLELPTSVSQRPTTTSSPPCPASAHIARPILSKRPIRPLRQRRRPIDPVHHPASQANGSMASEPHRRQFIFE